MKQRGLFACFALWLVGAQVAELFAVVGAVGAAVLVLSDRKKPTLTTEWSLLIAFIAAALVLPLFAAKLPTGTGVARLLTLATIPLAAAAAGRLTRRQIVIAVGAAAVTLVLSCLVAGLQHFGVWPSAERMQIFAALKLPFSRVYEEVPGAPGRFMAGGLLFHRLKFAHVSSLAVLVAAGWALSAKGRARWIAGATALVGVVSIFWFPFARAGAVALIFALAVLAALAARAHRSARVGLAAAGIGAVLIFAAALAVNEPLRARLLRSDSEEGSGGRRFLLSAGMAAVAAHPLTGVGVGRYTTREWLPPGAPIYVVEHTGKTHNQLLTVAAEAGVPAALLFVAFLVALGRRLYRSQPSGVAALLYFVALSFLHDPLFHAEFGLALGITLGLCLRPPTDVAAEVHPGK